MKSNPQTEKPRMETAADTQKTSPININPKSIGVLERDHTTALALSIFLGIFGIDQFYLGKTGKGILKLFTLGLFGILWVIDIIMIATKSVRGIAWNEEETMGKNWFARHKIFTGFIVLFVVGIIGASSSSNQPKTTTTPQTKQPQLAKIGQPARDGKFEFVVNSMKCGETTLSDGFGNVQATAQGQFCRFNVSVKDISTVPYSFDETAQYLYGPNGSKYSLSTNGTIWAQPSDEDPWGNDINPGNTLTGDLMFDVPKGVTPTTAELHDSGASDGVKVNLQ